MNLLKFADYSLRSILVPLNSLRIKNNPNESTLVRDLRKQVRGFSLPKETNLAHNQWAKNIIQLKKQILKKNPKNFLQWAVIRNTMFVGNALFTLREFSYLKKHNWKKWEKAIVDKNFVKSEPYILYPKTNGNIVHHAYHLSQFEQITGQKIKDFDYILEFGAGYGNMCLLAHNLGFKGKYFLFDFPVFSAIQTYFLKMNGLSASQNEKTENMIYCLNNLRALQKIIPKKGRGLFIATWSLSESPVKIRRKMLPILSKISNHLIGYQKQFNEINNQTYFKKYREMFTKLKWKEWEIKQLKGHCYLFGSKSSNSTL